MAQFLTTHGVASEIERIITGARRRLILVTPYLKLSQILLERLRDAAARRLTVSLVYGKTELSDPETNKLRSIAGLDLKFCANLHAKCYLNENAMVVTSMNLHEYSEKNNREVGILLTADEVAYQQGVQEIESILGNSIGLEPISARVRQIVSPKFMGSRPVVRDLIVLDVGLPVAGTNPHVVCTVEGIGRVAFWGHDNITLLRRRSASTPFTVRCGCRSANSRNDSGRQHDAWVPDTQRLTFI